MTLRDERGAIMIVGLAMAVFLVGTLYYLAGLGQAILQREGMQDAADAVAFSAASLHARGMNVIVLINMVMAALLAILVALKLLETLTYVAVVAIAVAGIFVPALAGFIPPLKVLGKEVKVAHDRLRPPIDSLLEMLHTLARGVRVAVPAVAQVRVIELVRSHHAPPAEFGFVVPTRLTLPTQDGTFDELCARAGNYVGQLVTLPLAVLVPGAVREVVADAVEDLTAAGAGWFCGSGGAPPATTIRYTARHPMLPSRQACADYDPSASGYSAREHDALCSQAERDEQASTPDATGRCNAPCNPELFAQRGALAAAACAPARGRSLSGFVWVQRDLRRSYRRVGGQWQAIDDASVPAPVPARVIESDKRPCGTRDSLVAQEWNTAQGQPVCSRFEPALPGGAMEGALASAQVSEVVQVLGCKERVEETRKVQPSGTVAGGAGKVPQALADGAELGEEDFQLRGAIVGALPSTVPENVVRIASWARAPGTSPGPSQSVLSAARELGRAAVAQAEFYYAVKSAQPEREDFMWNMRWQARLRRFRLPQRSAEPAQPKASDAVPGLSLPRATTDPAQACAQADAQAGRCDGLDLSLPELVIH
jgi:hypothetical protein